MPLFNTGANILSSLLTQQPSCGKMVQNHPQLSLVSRPFFNSSWTTHRVKRGERGRKSNGKRTGRRRLARARRMWGRRRRCWLTFALLALAKPNRFSVGSRCRSNVARPVFSSRPRWTLLSLSKRDVWTINGSNQSTRWGNWWRT